MWSYIKVCVCLPLFVHPQTIFFYVKHMRNASENFIQVPLFVHPQTVFLNLEHMAIKSKSVFECHYSCTLKQFFNVKHMIASSENDIWVPLFVHPQTVFFNLEHVVMTSKSVFGCHYSCTLKQFFNVKHMRDASENYIWVPLFVHPQTGFFNLEQMAITSKSVFGCHHPQTVFECGRMIYI